MGNVRTSGLFDCNGDRDEPGPLSARSLKPSSAGCFGRDGTPIGGRHGGLGEGAECSLSGDLNWRHVHENAESSLKRLHAASRKRTASTGLATSERDYNASTKSREHAFGDQFGESAGLGTPPSFDEVFFGALKGFGGKPKDRLAGTVWRKPVGPGKGAKLHHVDTRLYHKGGAPPTRASLREEQEQRFRPIGGGSPSRSSSKKTGRHAGNSSYPSAGDDGQALPGDFLGGSRLLTGKRTNKNVSKNFMG